MTYTIGIYSPATIGFRGPIPAEIHYTYSANRHGIRTPFI